MTCTYVGSGEWANPGRYCDGSQCCTVPGTRFQVAEDDPGVRLRLGNGAQPGINLGDTWDWWLWREGSDTPVHWGSVTSGDETFGPLHLSPGWYHLSACAMPVTGGGVAVRLEVLGVTGDCPGPPPPPAQVQCPGGHCAWPGSCAGKDCPGCCNPCTGACCAAGSTDVCCGGVCGPGYHPEACASGCCCVPNATGGGGQCPTSHNCGWPGSCAGKDCGSGCCNSCTGGCCPAGDTDVCCGGVCGPGDVPAPCSTGCCCVPGTPPPPPPQCTSDAGCTAPDTCVGGVCTAPAVKTTSKTAILVVGGLAAVGTVGLIAWHGAHSEPPVAQAALAGQARTRTHRHVHRARLAA